MRILSPLRATYFRSPYLCCQWVSVLKIDETKIRANTSYLWLFLSEWGWSWWRRGEKSLSSWCNTAGWVNQYFSLMFNFLTVTTVIVTVTFTREKWKLTMTSWSRAGNIILKFPSFSPPLALHTHPTLNYILRFIFRDNVSCWFWPWLKFGKCFRKVEP